ncbi:hypothetical protein [uncultured Photobacterium sp.]|uniref:hypothetical protein n=1 Tax=uncultured Photobacterium sp. TaxID=173973 RepID=UPI00262E670C|nr:hypothetical protein [uncultured Photobacterium sp.]
MNKDKFKIGLPKVKFEKGIPRVFVSEKHEKRLRWVVRGFTALGILISVISFPWYISLAIALTFCTVDFLVENVLFYYTSAYILPFPDFEYQSEKWVANMFMSMGEPEDPESLKIVGLTFDDSIYAQKFFELLRSWSKGNENRNGDLKLTFLIDEDMYFVYLYPDPESELIENVFKKTRKENELNKYGKEHLGLIMQMVICKGFETKGQFALGMFTNNHPEDKSYLLAPFIWDGNEPQPLTEIEPIEMFGYKCRIPSELTGNDFEKWHWDSLVSKDRVALG